MNNCHSLARERRTTLVPHLAVVNFITDSTDSPSELYYVLVCIGTRSPPPSCTPMESESVGGWGGDMVVTLCHVYIYRQSGSTYVGLSLQM